jgi:hypothetical protein
VKRAEGHKITRARQDRLKARSALVISACE